MDRAILSAAEDSNSSKAFLNSTASTGDANNLSISPMPDKPNNQLNHALSDLPKSAPISAARSAVS